MVRQKRRWVWLAEVAAVVTTRPAHVKHGRLTHRSTTDWKCCGSGVSNMLSKGCVDAVDRSSCPCWTS